MTDTHPYPAGAPSPANRIQMLETMLRARLFEEVVAARYAEQEMRCPVHLAIGQEAVAVGICATLSDGDTVWSNHRCHAHAIARGVSIESIAAELYGRATGCSGGKGGSMHLVGAKEGFPGTSAIVGGAVGLALGAALAAQRAGDERVAVAFFGDGAADEGIVYETMNFAVVRRLPLLLVCENNLYATCSSVASRQPPDCLVPRAHSMGMPAARVEGNDVERVFAAAWEALGRARRGDGPNFLECLTYRWMGHVGPSDDPHLGYRPPEERARWIDRCPIRLEARRLDREGLLPEAALGSMRRDLESEIRAAFDAARAAPEPARKAALDDVYAPADRVTGPWGKVPLGSPTPSEGGSRRRISFRNALLEAQATALEIDPRVFLYGVGADDAGGVFGSSLGLADRFGRTRVMDVPLSENALTALGAGAAIVGLRPVLVHLRMDFLLLGMDPLVNHAAKWRYMTGGAASAPLVIRCVVGRGWGAAAQHSQSLQALLAHVPGIRVVMPATPYDAKGLFLGAISGEDPVVFVEHRLLYDLEGLVPAEPYRLPMGRATCPRSGTDATVVATSWMVVEALGAAEVLASKGIDVEVLDLRTVKPLDEEAIVASIRRTGILVIADTGWSAFGVAAEVGALAAERAFESLRAPVRRVGLPDAPTPAARPLEQAYYPGAAEIVAAVEETVRLSRSRSVGSSDRRPPAPRRPKAGGGRRGRP